MHRRDPPRPAAPATGCTRPTGRATGWTPTPRRRAPEPRSPRPRRRPCARALLALGAWLLRDPAPGPSGFQGPVVVVLPFENLAEPGRWDRLARGVTEEVIADLATNPWLFVLADATTRPHAGATPQAVGAALGAGPRRHRHAPGRGRARPRHRRARRRRQRAPALGQAVGGTGRRPGCCRPPQPRRCRRARGPLVRRNRAGRPRAGASRLDPSLEAYDLFLLDRAQAPLDPRGLRARRRLPAPGGRDRPGLRQGVGRPVHRHGLRGELRRGRPGRRAYGSDPQPTARRHQPIPTTLRRCSRSAGWHPWTATSRRADRLPLYVHRSINGATIQANAWADRALALNPAAPGWEPAGEGIRRLRRRRLSCDCRDARTPRSPGAAPLHRRRRRAPRRCRDRHHRHRDLAAADRTRLPCGMDGSSGVPRGGRLRASDLHDSAAAGSRGRRSPRK